MTASTLTDSYITATLSHLPRRDQTQTERDLRAMIAANSMRRVGSGEASDAAEYATLATLGDPAELAARYVNGSGVLISSRIFRSWSLAIQWVCATVLPCLYLILVIAYAVNQDNIWVTLYRPAGIVLTVGVYLFAAVTALYALLDRQAGTDGPAPRWTPDQLAL